MYKVYVQRKDGSPLDPTTRFGWVRRAIRDKRAVVISRKPFVIRLTYDVEDPVTKSYIGSTDPGRTNIGNSVIDTGLSEVVYLDKVETRNKEIPNLMGHRKAYRQASRRGERLARKRLAAKHNSVSAKLKFGRKIPGCKKIIPVKDIINTEVRFKNRKRHCNTKDVLGTEKGWLTPTAKQLVQTHLNHIDQIRKLYPITGWCLEVNKFAFMLMEDGSVKGIDFQNGRLKGYKNAREYVFALQEGKCAECGAPIFDVHHIVPRHEDGSDTPDNLIGLCDECHHKVHIGELDIDKVGLKQKYGALSVLNQAIPYIFTGLIERFGEENVYTCTGKETYAIRSILNLPKDHDIDSVAIASASFGLEPKFGKEEKFSVMQFRRQNRAIIQHMTERTYKLDGEKVARNRKPREEQEGLALSQWFEKMVNKVGRKEAERLRSQLNVIKSKRVRNTRGRLMPGMTFLYQNKRYVMTGQITNGQYYRAVGEGAKNFPAKKCKVLTKNQGLVYI